MAHTVIKVLLDYRNRSYETSDKCNDKKWIDYDSYKSIYIVYT